jgi:membrane protein YdbS with pleckstrin-like domain
MSLLINKDGKQLGPYSLDEARAQVLAGKLSPTDWAWADGAADWVLLKDVPGFTLAAKPAPPDAAALGSAIPAAGTPAIAAEEQELWSGHPSQLLNLGIYLFWAIVLVITGSALILFVSGVTNPMFWIGVIFGAVFLIALVNVAIAYFHLRAIHYVVSTQRVRIVAGLFSKEIQEIELFRVKDTSAHQSFLLRLAGLGTITILSGDEKQPRLVLDGIPHSIELRERIRAEVMTLRQRFGVRELDVM